MNKKLILQLMPSNTQTLQMTNPQTETIELTMPRSDNTRAKLKINTTAGWQGLLDYIPEYGEIIVYSDRNVINGENYPGVKIGDGLAFVVDLPFVGDEISSQIITDLNQHITNQVMHVTQEERDYWNSKLNLDIDGENLILSPIPME